MDNLDVRQAAAALPEEADGAKADGPVEDVAGEVTGADAVSAGDGRSILRATTAMRLRTRKSLGA